MLQYIPRILTVLYIVLFFALTPAAQAADKTPPPHGHDCATAEQIMTNSEVPALLTSTSDYAFYKLVLDRRGLLDVEVDPGTMDVWDMELRDSSCNPIPGVVGAESMLTGHWAKLTVPHKGMFSVDASVWTLPAGMYFIRIRPNPVDVFQDKFMFRTTYIPHYGHDCASAEPIRFGSPIDGELLYAEDREVFRLTTYDIGRIHIWTTGPLLPPQEPVIELYFSDCSKASAVLMKDEEFGVTTAYLAPGTYYLSLEPWRPEYLGRFSLHVEFDGKQSTLASNMRH